ncbi:MAG: hypothetical protein ACKORF_05125 [Micrococcales bacterium]
MDSTLNQPGSWRASWDAWLDEIAAIGVSNPLQNFEPDTFGQIDLERAHPGGLAQFVSSRAASLSNLVRDPLAYSRALNAAKRIRSKSETLLKNFGVESSYLVGGLVSMVADGFDLRLPVFLWRVHLLSKGDDFELSMVGTPQVNPALKLALETCYGVHLDESQLLGTLQQGGDLVPISSLDYLTNLVGSQGRLDLKRILVVGNFTNVPTLLRADVGNDPNDLLRLIAAGEPVSQGVDATLPTPISVTDTDSAQDHIVSRAMAGHSFAVETLPGCGYLQTVASTVANLAAMDKRVLVVAPRRQTLDELADRMSHIGLPGLVARGHFAWLDLISAISRNEKATTNLEPSAEASLVGIRAEIDAYFEALHRLDNTLGVSVQQILRRLAELSALPHPPVTEARISKEKLLENADRTAAVRLLQQAWDLGEFKFGPQDSAWFQARFETPEEVTQAIAVANRLRAETYPTLAKKLEEFISSAEFKPARSIADWNSYLRLFVGIRESLDKFTPDVFDRPLGDLITATANRKVKGEMSGGTRRKLRKLAKEFVRPGMHVADLNTALRAIEEQRESWHLLTTGLKPPMVPTGINDALISFQALSSDLENLQQHLDSESQEEPLAKLPLAKLEAKLESLCNDTGALENLGARAMVAKELRDLGLGSVMRDFARLHVARENIGLELELAWWQSALEILVGKNTLLLALSGDQISVLEQRFAELDAQAVADGSTEVAAKFASRWRAGLGDHADQAGALKAILRAGDASLPQVIAAAPDLISHLTTVFAVSPYEVPVFSKSSKFDVVLVLDAAGSTVAENLSALMRANQVIAFGDDAIANPTGFEVEAREIPIGREIQSQSVYNAVRNVFGAEVLRRSYRPNGQILGTLINREFYQNRIEFEPSLDDYFGHTKVTHELIVSGTGVTATSDAASESPDAELAKTVDLIFNHALWNPEESLLVASASSVHAERIKTEVRNGLKSRTHLAAFFDSHGLEKFEVAAISDLAHRSADRVIFSVGFGLNAKGELGVNLGQLTSPDGRRALANLLVSARKHISVVTCFTAAQLGTERVIPGVSYLADLLAAAVSVEVQETQLDPDPMLLDLAKRLRKLGATVKAGYGQRIGLVASYGNKALIVEPDWSLVGASYREKLRIRPATLRSLGWQYQRVYSFDLFSNPEQVARNIAESLGLKVYDRAQPLFEIDDRAFEDTDMAWGETPDSNDQRLRQDKPPHWG